MAMALKDKYFTISEAAREMDVTRQTISRWIAEGKFLGEKIGRETLIKKDDVYEYQGQRVAASVHNWIVKRVLEWVKAQYHLQEQDEVQLNNIGEDGVLRFNVTTHNGVKDMVNVLPEVGIRKEKGRTFLFMRNMQAWEEQDKLYRRKY
jgi:excisionase family DNA binding protein